MKNICGIILRTDKNLVGISDEKILGRTCQDWVALSLGEGFSKSINFAYDESDIPKYIRQYIDKQKPYTVVLFADTPLITKKTVSDAVNMLVKKGLNVLKMTRGFVFKTKFLETTDSLYVSKPHYFEEEDLITASDYKQVALIIDILKNRIINFHMSQGVHIVDPPSTFIDSYVTIAKNVRIEPNNILRGKTIVKEKVFLDSGNVIDSSVIDEGAKIASSRLEYCYVGKYTTVGPFAYIRPDSVISDNCKIGDFVEIKKSIIGQGTKVSHMSYVGDTEIGQNTNVGCGVVFANYDGVQKKPCKVGNNVFIGSNTNLVAPLSICDDTYIAAGSTITQSVTNAEGLVIARAKQQTIKEWKRPQK